MASDSNFASDQKYGLKLQLEFGFVIGFEFDFIAVKIIVQAAPARTFVTYFLQALPMI